MPRRKKPGPKKGSKVGRRAATTPAPPAAPANLQVDDPWGDVPAPDPTEIDNEAPLPELTGSGNLGEIASDPSDAIKQLGPPMGNVRSQAEWGYALVMTQAYEAANDATVSAATRERRTRQLLAAAMKMFPEAQRQEAAREIRESRRAVDDKKRARRAAAVLETDEAVAGGEADNVIQFRGTRG